MRPPEQRDLPHVVAPVLLLNYIIPAYLQECEDAVEDDFTRTLVACIGEGRHPAPQDLAIVTEKIWLEAFPEDRKGDNGSRATRLAGIALVGDNLLE